MGLPITNISDTALWVAVYRADESDRPDAAFYDPYARQLAGEKGEKVVRAMQDGRANSWSFVARTVLFDRIVMEHVAAGFNQVVNLASGLDTRPYRLNLPSSLNWIDIDLPAIVDYMNEQMAIHTPGCLLQRYAMDLSKRKERLALFHAIAKEKRTLVMSEGLIGYLPEEEAGSLAYDLSHIPGFEHWALDLMSPPILTLINREMGTLLSDADTPLVFAPEEGEDFFRLFGWKAIASYSKMKTALSMNRVPENIRSFAELPEPDTHHRGNFPWSGVCLFENTIQ